MFVRFLEPRLREAVADRPVVTLVGPRQSGKSTLARALVADGTLDTYLTLDDALVLAAATADPDGFVAGLTGRTVIDEVQHAPALARAIKASVDRDRRPGRFLLTGSSDVMALPGLADALVGRMEVLTLLPLTQGELDARQERFIDRCFEADLPPALLPGSGPAIEERILRGGFPEPVTFSSRRRAAWYGSYVTTIIQRDIRDLARITGLEELPRLLSMLAARTSTLLNIAELSRTSGLPQSTLKRYLALLEAAFLIETVPAWTGDPGRRLVHAPKLHLTDAGLAAWLTGVDAPRLHSSREQLGALLESFVAGEIRRQAGWSDAVIRRSHYRSHDGREVDLILEDRAGRLVGIEVKAARSVGNDDVRGLRALAERSGDRFLRGVLLHTGESVVPFAANLHAMPVSALWSST